MKKFAGAVLLLVALFVASSYAQTTVAYEVQRYDITAQVDTAQNSLSATSTMKLINIGTGAGRTITLLLGPNGKVNSVSVNGANATFNIVKTDSTPDKNDTRPKLETITVNAPSPIAAGASATVAVTYNFAVPES